MDEQKVAQEQETQLEPKKETQVAAPVQFDWMNTKSLAIRQQSVGCSVTNDISVRSSIRL